MKADFKVGNKIRSKKVRFVVQKVDEKEINGKKEIVYYVNDTFFVKDSDIISQRPKKKESEPKKEAKSK